MKVELGYTYRDKISGFRGVCTGLVQYISGCNQAVLTPSVKKEGSLESGCWFDEQRLTKEGDPCVVLENVATPGFGDLAPVR